MSYRQEAAYFCHTIDQMDADGTCVSIIKHEKSPGTLPKTHDTATLKPGRSGLRHRRGRGHGRGVLERCP